MTCKRLVHVTLAAALIASLSTPAMAQDEPEFDLKSQRNLFEIGLYLGIFLPPSDHELYDVDLRRFAELESVAFDVGLRLGYLPFPFVGIELEGGIMPSAFADEDMSALMFHARGHVIGQYPMGRIVPFLVAGYGMIGISSDDTAVGSDIDGAFHAGLGCKYYPFKWLALRADARINVSGQRHEGGLKPYFEFLFGASYVIGYKEAVKEVVDSDGDGVPDDKDKCPDVSAQTPDGCPADKDGDGIPDDKDKCPDVPAKTPDGCPADKDGDGVTDDKDKCPDVPAKTLDGCPPDKDGDGVLDADDKCPDVAGPKPGGCPDKDGDGIPDPNDKCPDQPETKNGYNDADGCPDTVPKKIKPFTGAIQGITFPTDKATIRKKSYKTLNAAAKIMKKFKDLTLLVRGHTDDRGTDEHNMDLSDRRAKAVKAYLVKKGVDAARLTTEAVGSREPVDQAKTKEARAKNRRIEFKVTQGGMK